MFRTKKQKRKKTAKNNGNKWHIPAHKGTRYEKKKKKKKAINYVTKHKR